VITIYVSNGETPIAPLPSFIGLTVEEAQAAADEFSLTTGVRLTFVTEDAETDDPGLVGRIVATNPPPGTEIAEAATVVVSVGVLAVHP
jgi:serine/threonine-protein kinase